MGLARLHITPDCFLSVLHGRYEVVSHGVPVDATAHTCVYDVQTHCLILVLEHPSFPDVQPGEILPLLPSPSIRRWDVEDPAP